MSAIDSHSALNALRKWQDHRLSALAESSSFKKIGPSNITILIYFFRPKEKVASSFRYSISAIYETWRHCGLMKTIIVVNNVSKPILEFQEKNAKWVSVQIEPDLIPGDIDAMSRDCNTRLHTRFNTPYVLIIQDDGFPIRSGIEKFTSKCDFLGAPFRRRNLKGLAASILLRHCPSNGGFSLRTKKICKLVAKYHAIGNYNNYHFKPDEGEDIFYTDILPRRFLSYRLSCKPGNSFLSSDFSFDGTFPDQHAPSPFGFHSARAFQQLKAEGLIAD